MPVFHNKVSNLYELGPTVEVIILPPLPVYNQLKAEGKTDGEIVRKIIALIDTGATNTCIGDNIAKEMNLIARDVVSVMTPQGSCDQPVYDIGVVLPNAPRNVIPTLALGAELEKQPYDALIGRDVLSKCTLIYNGWDNSYQLHI